MDFMNNFTADQVMVVLSGLNYQLITINLLAVVAGLMAHVWKKMRSESVTFKQYWTMYGMNSVATITALATSFISMMTMAPDTPVYAYFMMAYMGDSLLNKPPVNQTVQSSDRGLMEDLQTLNDKFDDLKDVVVTETQDAPWKLWLGVAGFCGVMWFFVTIFSAVAAL